MNAKVTLKEKMAIIKMLTKHFTIGEGAEDLINALISTSSGKEKQEEFTDLVLFAFATIAKPLIDDVSVEPLQKEKGDEHFPPEEKILIKCLRSKLNLIKRIHKVCGISLSDAARKASQIVSDCHTGADHFTFTPFFIGNTPKSIFTIKEWEEICYIMHLSDETFKVETL